MKTSVLLSILLICLQSAGQDSTMMTRIKSIRDKYKVEINGALRFNYNLSTWKPEQVRRGGDFGYDLFRLNVKAEYKSVFLDAEYRQYSTAFGGAMMKRGIIGYRFSKNTRIETGLTQVPFGNQEYNSNNWFFNMSYYIGMEDDYDMGIKFVQDWRKVRLQLAFFKNAEELTFGDTSSISPSRYSYDVSGDNKEVNQGNFKIDFIIDKERKSSASISGEYGSLYNIKNQRFGDHMALGVAYDQYFFDDRFNLKFQALGYLYRPKGPDTLTVELSAYGSSYLIPVAGEVVTLGLSYTIPVSFGPFEEIKVYNDVGVYTKTEPAADNSWLNVSGALFSAGPLQTFVDFAFGKNHPWLSPDPYTAFIYSNDDSQWYLRFNINLGYYF